MGWKAIIHLDERSTETATDSGVTETVRVYVFRGWKDAVCSAAAGPAVIAAFGSPAGLSTYFGGYMTFGGVFSSNAYLGVWGHRNASRFRRILKERLGEIEIIHAKPPKWHVGSKVNGSRLSKPERDAAEASFRGTWSSS